MNRTKSIHDFPVYLEKAGIDTKELGAVMLPIQPIDIFADGDLDPYDLYASNDPKKFWVQGDVTDKMHVTLLYGLLTPAYQQEDNVHNVLAGWTTPQNLMVDGVSIFPSEYPDEQFSAVVLEVSHPALLEAHKRLSYLPHVNTYPDYKAHATLAYVNSEKAHYWKRVLDEKSFQMTVDVTRQLDMGSSHD